MRAAVVSLGSISSKWISEALKNYFDEVDVLDIRSVEVYLGGRGDRIFYEGKPLRHYDCVYARGSSRYATLLNSITTILRKETYFPLKPKSYTLGHDKILSHLRFEAYSVPTPKTFLASTAEAGKRILDKVSYPLVLKIPSGTHGKGVMFADSKESASSMIDALALLRQPILMQEFIDTDGVDTRAIVVGDKVVAAMHRIAKKGDKRSNVHMGGSTKPIEIDPVSEKIAIDAANAIGAEICAVDLVVGIRGPLVLEVNVSPGLQGITKTTGINVADLFAKHLLKKTKEFNAKESSKAIDELVLGGEVISPLEFRGTRIILPEFANRIFKGKSKEEVVIHSEKDKVTIARQKNPKQ